MIAWLWFFMHIRGAEAPFDSFKNPCRLRRSTEQEKVIREGQANTDRCAARTFLWIILAGNRFVVHL